MGQVVGFPSKNYARMQYNPRNTIEYFPMANAQIFLRVTFVESSPRRTDAVSRNDLLYQRVSR